MGKIKKIVVGSLSLIVTGASVCLAVPVIKNAIGSKNNDSTQDNITEVVENETIINNESYNKILRCLEDAIEIKLNNPIKEVQIENIKADEQQMSFYTFVTVNNATQSNVNYKIDYANNQDTFTKYTAFIEKDLNNITQEEIETFWTDVSYVTTYNNMLEVKGIKKVENNNISTLTKSIVKDCSNNASLDANVKAQMSATANSYDNMEIVESYFISRGYDRNSDSYLYDFNGIVFINGYQAEIHATVSSDYMISDTEELSALALKEYQKDSSKFNVKFTKASILNYTMVTNTNKGKTQEPELDM